MCMFVCTCAPGVEKRTKKRVFVAHSVDTRPWLSWETELKGRHIC